METKSYRFNCEIVDEETGEVIVAGSTFVSSHITEFGECESVDQEVGKLLRVLRSKKEIITNEKEA